MTNLYCPIHGDVIYSEDDSSDLESHYSQDWHGYIFACASCNPYNDWRIILDDNGYVSDMNPIPAYPNEWKTQKVRAKLEDGEATPPKVHRSEVTDGEPVYPSEPGDSLQSGILDALDTDIALLDNKISGVYGERNPNPTEIESFKGILNSRRRSIIEALSLRNTIHDSEEDTRSSSRRSLVNKSNY